MVSTKERQRWDRMWATVTTRMQRQKDRIGILALAQIEAIAALVEIEQGDLTESQMRARAHAAVETIKNINESSNGKDAAEEDSNLKPDEEEDNG